MSPKNMSPRSCERPSKPFGRSWRDSATTPPSSRTDLAPHHPRAAGRLRGSPHAYPATTPSTRALSTRLIADALLGPSLDDPRRPSRPACCGRPRGPALDLGPQSESPPGPVQQRDPADFGVVQAETQPCALEQILPGCATRNPPRASRARGVSDLKLEFRGGDWQSGAGYDISVRDDGEANHERIEVVHEDAGVGVACDPEVVFHAEMQLDVTWNHAPPRAASDGGLPTTLGDVPDLRTTWHRPAQGRCTGCSRWCWRTPYRTAGWRSTLRPE
jgi:hypothetical protein